MKRLSNALCLICLTMFLAGCDSLPFNLSEKLSLTPKEDAAQAPSAIDPSAPPPIVDPLAATPPIDLSPEGSLGALGLNLETYFENNIGTPNERITRVERALTAIQGDLRRLAPPIRRLITIERDIQALVTQLAGLTEAPQAALTPPAAMVPAATTVAADMNSTGPPAAIVTPPPPAPQAAVTASPPQSGGKAVSGAAGNVDVKRVRIGEHKDKTRLVLDLSGPASYSYDLDNAENLLVIDLPQTATWSGAKEWPPNERTGKKSPLLAAYSVVTSDKGGHRLIVQLTQDAQVWYEGTYQSNGYPDYRIVIDLHGPQVHTSAGGN